MYEVKIIPSARKDLEHLDKKFFIQVRDKIIALASEPRPNNCVKLTADEGGLAPPFSDSDQMLKDTVESIEVAGFEPGVDVSMAIDVAASHFHQDGVYELDDHQIDSLKLIEQIEKWVGQYPIISVEDGLAEEDWDIGVRLSRMAYEIGGVGPEDIDLAEVHDATAFGELHQTEALGFCGAGEGGPFAESGATRLGGKIPINTSGGLESRGHPIGASGLGQINELVTQLRHEAESRQVQNCRLALAENGGGNLAYEEAAMGIHILERVSQL